MIRLCRGCNQDISTKPHQAKYCARSCYNKAQWMRTKADPLARARALRSGKVASKQRKQRRWDTILSLHGNRCCRCQQTFPRCVYDLHHTEVGIKKSRRDNSAVIIHSGTDAEFVALLKITCLICANCHRLEHNNGKPYGT